MPRRPRPGGAMNERNYQDTVVELLHVFGYAVDHTYPLQTKHGFYRTPSTMKGKPDLTALRPPRVLAIEIKTDRGRATTEQVACLTVWSEIPCARAWLLRPRDDWDTLVGWVRSPKHAPRVYGFDPIPITEARLILAPRSAVR